MLPQGRWVSARDLKSGDVFETRLCKNVQITNIDVRTEITTVYNITVEDFHTYAVGECEILVHNKAKIPGHVLDSAQKAEKAVNQKNHPFREWFHRNYKHKSKIGNKERHNPDMDPFELAEAWEEWQSLGCPSTIKPK